MSKKLCIIANSALLVWFFFDMFGFSIGNFVLVEGAWKDIDGIWYLIFIGLFILFCAREKYGKYPLSYCFASAHIICIILYGTILYKK